MAGRTCTLRSPQPLPHGAAVTDRTRAALRQPAKRAHHDRCAESHPQTPLLRIGQEPFECSLDGFESGSRASAAAHTRRAAPVFASHPQRPTPVRGNLVSASWPRN